jgi:hypothetical protein
LTSPGKRGSQRRRAIPMFDHIQQDWAGRYRLRLN